MIKKLLIGLVLLGGLGFLFYRSVQQTRAEPYTVDRARLQGWTVQADGPSSPGGYVASLRPPAQLGAELFRQVFTRGMESLSAPVDSAVPLVPRVEYDRVFAGRVSAEKIAELARAGGLETAPFEPRCMGHERVSEPGSTRQLYFVLFEAPAFVRFREQLANLIEDPTLRSAFDPASQSPVMFIAASDPEYARWLPLRVDGNADCVAPISVE